MSQYKIAIVGSGPSAFYAAQAIFKSEKSISVDMFEKLPTPFGLLRAGVAPDHQQMKTIAKAYDRIAQHEQFRFFGNVAVGDSITVKELSEYYHSVIICVGSDSDRRMSISGEDLKGSHTATEFVAWYNGHPNFQQHQFDLSGSTAVVIGQGNVAVDVTRILAKSNEDLKHTDIVKNALDALNKSHITDIYMVGRRGPVQAAFTELELKELGEIDGVDLKIHHDLNLSDSDKIEIEDASKARKNIALLQELVQKEPLKKPKKTIHILFNHSPVELHGDGKLNSVTFEKTMLTGDPGKQRAVGSGEFVTINCDILFRSIGYKGTRFKNVPFDEEKGVIPNIKGQVIDDNQQLLSKLFVSGWIKRGPSGVIGTNRSDSIETVSTCLQTIEQQTIEHDMDIERVLNDKRLSYITYSDWQKIDEMEIEKGKKVGKPREKFTSIDTILNALGK